MIGARSASRASRAFARRLSTASTTSEGGAARRAPYALSFVAGLAVAGAASRYISVPAARAEARPSTSISSTDAPFEVNFDAAIAELKAAFPESQLSTVNEELTGHARSSNTYHRATVPVIVFYPESTEDVSKAVKIAHKYRMPITPYSGATSLEGHIISAHGGMTVDMSRMDKILAIHEADGDLVLQSGARWQDVNEELEERGIPLFFPLDPGPGATIGGMIGTGCSGTNAMRYGTARSEWFLNATVVLPDGTIIKTRSRARKSSAGFDLTKLFIGAEGTLGIVTEATIRLAPLLPTRVAICSFPNVEAATACVIDVVNRGLPVQCAELMDAFGIKAINASGICTKKYQEDDSVFFKLQGDDETISRAAETIGELVKKHSGTSMKFAASKEESDEIWHGRKVMRWSLNALKPGCDMLSTDVCVPISKLPQLIKETQADLKEHGIMASCFGHAGDGNFHAPLMFMGEEELPMVEAAAHRLVDRALALEGTCTGEHGVGVGKKKYLRKELGDGTVDLMQLIKDAIDPTGIMNPGKLYPDRK